MEHARGTGFAKHRSQGGRDGVQGGSTTRGGRESAETIPVKIRGGLAPHDRSWTRESRGATRGTSRASRSSPERHPVVPVADGAFPFRVGVRARDEASERDGRRSAPRTVGEDTHRGVSSRRHGESRGCSERAPSMWRRDVRRAGSSTVFWETFVQGFAFYASIAKSSGQIV